MVGEYQAKNPGLAKLDLGQLKAAFMEQYGSYFGASNNQGALQQQGVNPTIASQNNPISQSPYQELQAYGAQLNQPNPITEQLLGGGNTSSQLQSILGQQTNPTTGL